MRFRENAFIVISAVIMTASTSVLGNPFKKQNITAIAADDSKTYSSWQEGYKELLKTAMSEEVYCSKAEFGENMCSTYAIRDLNNDGTPELFINYSPASFAYSELYTFYDSKIIKLMTLPRAGFVSYSPQTDLIYSNGGNAAGGYIYNNYFKIVNGSIVDVENFLIGTSALPWKYYLNDQEITEEAYESDVNKYGTINWVNVEREKYFEDIDSDFKNLITPSHLGDVDNDGQINAVDASSILSYYAMASTNQDGGYTEEQKLNADVDKNGSINAVDASQVLSYYAYTSTTKEAVITIDEYIRK
ncbi:dockerin type I domain-containing protein [Ruminococcus sp.]|uniref:dockerin type I domain-containing protein n=1 Tax=Ruminococcus sp. TaxID=41978 RepID=UPI0025CC0B76|nr:dockerin type I domain-containing protein [Ruminococcus sp.]